MAGALAGIRIVEFAGIGPGPFAAMMLADHGAEVIRVERPGARFIAQEAASRSRKSIVVNLKTSQGIDVLRRLCRSAHGIIEGFRPGVMERLGLGPDVLIGDNPGLVYGRMTGWGQYGPLAQAAGHDINYIALSGALHMIGRKSERPVPPVNLVGDFGGGGMLLAFGMVAALLACRLGSPGQVIDAAITDGSSLLAAMAYGLRAAGHYRDERGVNMIDGGSHYYDTYVCADGAYIAIGAIEPAFYAELRARLGLSEDREFDVQQDRAAWPILKQKLEELFRSRSRAEWSDLLEGTEACFAPVLSMEEAPRHPHNVERATFIDVAGTVQPAPAPRFSATPAPPPCGPGNIGSHTRDVLQELGLEPHEVDLLYETGVLG